MRTLSQAERVQLKQLKQKYRKNLLNQQRYHNALLQFFEK